MVTRKKPSKKATKQTSKKPHITPLGDRVLIEELAEEHTKTEFGIIIPETAEKDSRNSRGRVVAVGEGKRANDGSVIPLQVSVGNTVLYSAFAADSIEVEGKEYAIVSEGSILAILN